MAFAGIDSECAICFADVMQMASVLECGHSYCDGCIQAHLVKKKDCPTCHEPASRAIPNYSLRNILEAQAKKVEQEAAPAIAAAQAAPISDATMADINELFTPVKSPSPLAAVNLRRFDCVKRACLTEDALHQLEVTGVLHLEISLNEAPFHDKSALEQLDGFPKEVPTIQFGITSCTREQVEDLQQLIQREFAPPYSKLFESDTPQRLYVLISRCSPIITLNNQGCITNRVPGPFARTEASCTTESIRRLFEAEQRHSVREPDPAKIQALGIEVFQSSAFQTLMLRIAMRQIHTPCEFQIVFNERAREMSPIVDYKDLNFAEIAALIQHIYRDSDLHAYPTCTYAMDIQNDRGENERIQIAEQFGQTTDKLPVTVTYTLT